MVKGNPKSSATSATRKKHLKKHEQPDETPKEKKQKGKKGQKKEPRVKMYIPPVKPAPVQPDPLETTGLAHSLPADLLVVLRNVSKKAQVTKTRALEDLQSGWVNQCLKDGKESPLVYTLVEMLPVWLHHVSALFTNPSRRIRFLTASLHSTLLQIPPVREQIIFILRESTSSSQLENVLGTWCLATHDVDRSVATTATRPWKELESTLNATQHVNPFIQRVILDPSQVYADLNPQPPPPPAQAVASGKNRSGKASTSRKDEEDQSARSKQDEQEESEQDRRARLRIGGLGAARWILSSSSTLSEELQTFYSNPALWTILHHAEAAPWVDLESFGFAQPNVRKAGWSLLQTLLTMQKDRLEPLLPTLSTAILRSAWVESDSNVQSVMWQPLLTFLKQFPQCWTTDANNRQGAKENEGDSDEEDEEEKAPLDAATLSSAKQASEAYAEFLQFLRLGCSGSPMQGYQTVVIVVSTIPTSIITSSISGSFSEFFTAFWEALSSRALSSLQRIAASAAFLSSLLECVVFLVKRIKNDEASSITQQTLVRTQFNLVWEELSSKKLKVEERAAARLLAQTLESLFNIDSALFRTAWEVLGDGVKASVENEANSSLVAASLKVFYDKFKKGTALRPYAEVLMKSILEKNIENCEKVLGASASHADEPTTKSGFDLLVGVFDQFREGLFVDEGLAAKLDNMVSNNAYILLSVSPSLLLAYLINRKDESKVLGIWHTLLTNIASSFVAGNVPDKKAITNLLEAAQRGRLPKYLTPQSGELDAVVGDLLEQGLNDSEKSEELSVVRQILLSSDYFVSRSGLNTFLQVIIATFTANVTDVICGKQVAASTFDNLLALIQATFAHVLKELSLMNSLLPDLFFLAHLLPIFSGIDGIETEVTLSQANAAELWKQWFESATDAHKAEMTAIISEKLKDIMKDTSMKVIPEDVLHMILEKPIGFQVDPLDIFPSSTQLDSRLEELGSNAIDYSIAILEPLIPPTSPSSLDNQFKSTDYRGFSSYARIINGLLQTFGEERSLARRNMWALRHFYALSISAQDLLNVPSASSKSPTFDDKVSPVTLRDIVLKAKQVSVYLFNSAMAKEDESWKRSVLDLLLNDKNGKEGLSQLQAFLLDVVGYSRKGDMTRDARILKVVLDSLFADGMDAAEADLWVQYARKIEKTAPQTSITIISAITNTGAEPPKLDRYRNELAAGLLGIKPTKANAEGLLSLRKLVATAPNPDGDVIFLQPPRAINVIKACQAWVLAEGDDDDELDEVQSAMLPIFMHLAPILQNVQGGHWGFIFDVLEATLEGSSGNEEKEEEDSSVDEASRLLGLSRALRLVYVIEDLVKTNKGLMAEWEERRVGILNMIRDLRVIGNDSGEISSKPRSVCRELALSIAQHLPSSLIDQDTLSKMCHLIEDPSPTVQKMAYQFLKAAAQKRTEHFVIEAGVDTEATIQATLPPELLELVSRQMNFTGVDEEGGIEGEGEEQLQNIFGYLLGWMLVFDLFQDASFKVRSNYIDQLRSLNLVFDHFIPCFLAILRLNQGGLQKAFKLDIWAVDQFYVNLYEPGNPHTIPVLTAHIFYRALLTIPSLIHSWVLDCKDRQLMNTVTNYTSTHFSPVLIHAELEHVRAHSTKDGLADDNLSIKVAPAVNEVVAAYSVDEHQLEVRLKVPSDWPLHRIEVRDVKRVGVDENRWRAWVLGIQQTIWSHNGRIIDGLGLFKKNVTLHFEGQVECAICYSIISVMDNTLPKKPCKTCKNRFHAGCLYKWFNTSHSSSCPLCRSDII